MAVRVNSAIIDMQYSVLPEYGKLDLIFSDKTEVLTRSCSGRYPNSDFDRCLQVFHTNCGKYIVSQKRKTLFILEAT